MPTAAKAAWKTKFEDMMKITCQALRVGTLYTQDFENTQFNLPGVGGYMSDQVPPYCGKRSVERQTRLMHLYGKRKIDANRYGPSLITMRSYYLNY